MNTLVFPVINSPVSIVWLRRDLRLDDHAAFAAALQADTPILPLFIFDKEILSELKADDKRVVFIHNALHKLNAQLAAHQSSILVLYGSPVEVWTQLVRQYTIITVYANRDYEPYAKTRDKAIEELLADHNITFKLLKDHVLFESGEILTQSLRPYTVFTPFKRRWLELIEQLDYKPLETYKGIDTKADKRLVKFRSEIIPLETMGFKNGDISINFPENTINTEILTNYETQRNFPGIRGTSRLGVHLRFGTVSIRKVAVAAKSTSAVFLSELIWRDFYQMLLDTFPHTPNRAFKPAYDQIQWLNDEKSFERWKEGQTGYPLVDAGMRELNTTGFMHNRVRMVVASFLTKHLLIDWRWGERYFAEKLLDFDLAANVGGWQWAAGTGSDAAPYFRIFNPTEQARKFDPDRSYIKTWVPEVDSFSYPKPIVDHAFARARCLEVYKKAVKE